MGIKINDYTYGFKLVSLALDEYTRDDLNRGELDVLFVKDGKIMLYPVGIELKADISYIQELEKQNNYDVYEIWPNGRMFLRFDNASIDNYFFVTGKCNSNCIMCPSSDFSRKNGDLTNVKNLIELAKHIPSDTKHLTVTGGEPFLSGEVFFEFVSFLRDKFINTECLFLTNGRIFAVKKYAELLRDSIPYNSILAIPIHGSTSNMHDYITQASKSFEQTLQGIKRLLRFGIKIEIRIVVSKVNCQDIEDIADLIIKEIPQIDYVSVIAMEMTGSAFKNKDELWLTYSEAFKAASEAIKKLIKHGIDVKLYNFPLCTVKPAYWTMCEKSISPNKVCYAECCEECNYRKSCGGVFAGTINMERNELRAIK